MTEAIYVVGDIHGRYDLLQKAQLEIARDYDGAATVVFLGDYIDRGPQGCAVVKCLMRGPARDGDRWVCLRGNHEQMALDAHQPGGNRYVWPNNGGDATLKSFGGTLSTAVLARFRDLPLRHETEQHSSCTRASCPACRSAFRAMRP